MATPKTRQPVPELRSLQDLTIIEAFDPGASASKYVTFYHVTREDVVFFGQLFKPKNQITLAEYGAALEHVPDDEIYPHVPLDTPALTRLPDDLAEEAMIYIKRPGLVVYESTKGTRFIPTEVLNETLAMERIAAHVVTSSSSSPHPNIVRYLGCRVRHGRITCIGLERLDCTLAQYVQQNDADGDQAASMRRLDDEELIQPIESALRFLHAELGMAHNDVSPYNIMLRRVSRDAVPQPVLIDFGSSAPFGQRLQSLGSPGFSDGVTMTSQAESDLYAIGKVREWLRQFRGGSYGKGGEAGRND